MRRKWWGVGIGTVLIGGSVAGWFWWKDGPAPAAAAVVTTTVQRGELVSGISGTGSIQAAERETIVAGVAGTVEEVLFKDGVPVKKGDVLLTFEQEDTADQIETKVIDLEKQRLELEQLQLQYKQAAEAGDDAQASIAINIRKQELTITALENEIASLEDTDALDPIVAPIDGKLSGFDVEPGDALREDAELGEVVNFASMKMVVGVDELDIADVELGQEATVLVDALPDSVFAGVVADIAEEGTANNGVASFDVTVLLTEIEGLKAGMSAEASIVTARKEDALFLPIDAVQSFRNQYFVIVPAADAAAEGGAAGEGETPEGGAETPTSQSGAATSAPQAGARREGAAAGGLPGEAAAAQAPGAASGFRSGGGESLGRGQAAGAAGGDGAQTRVFVEVGIHNEDSIEIVSGLAEGDVVELPTATAAATRGAVPGGFGVGGFGVPAAPGGFGGGAGRQAGGFDEAVRIEAGNGGGPH